MWHTFITSSVTDVFGRIRIQTFGTGFVSETTKIDLFLPFVCGKALWIFRHACARIASLHKKDTDHLKSRIPIRIRAKIVRIRNTDYEQRSFLLCEKGTKYEVNDWEILDYFSQ
jgi:hypothetical protein